MIPFLSAAAFGAMSTSDVARGWYLWRVGRDTEAWEVARDASVAEPDDWATFQLLAAMEIVRGAGPSLEIAVREQWGQAPADPVQRTRLATVVALRNVGPGPHCDEVTTLVSRVPDGEAHTWATFADRQRELRCEGTTDHADAELRRLLDAGATGWADGVLAKVDARYFKSDLPPELERLWAEQPERLDRAGAVFHENVSGPGRNAAQRVTEQALEQAAESDDPVLVYAALVAYRTAAMDKKAEAALAHLRTLDPHADATLARSLDDVADPPIYRDIAECSRRELNAALVCLDGLTAPEGPATAALQFQRRAVLESLRRPDEAHAAAREAWQADPTNRTYARWFVKSAVARQQDAELAAQAIEVAIPPIATTAAPDTVQQEKRAPLAADLDLRTQVFRLAGRAPEAIEGQRYALALAPTPERRLLLGLVLADAGAADEALLQLSHGLVKAQDDTARISAARDALALLAKPRKSTVALLVAEAGREPGAVENHPLLGKVFAVPEGWLAAPVEGAKPAPAVLVTWSTIEADWSAMLDRVEGLAALYGKDGVRFGVLGLDPTAPGLPADLALHTAQPGPAAATTVQSIALPTVLVLDAKGKVLQVFAPWDSEKLDLEKTLDGLK
jgi:tetratricopeptide (TPR) repeat protein